MRGCVSRVLELDSFDVERQQNTHKETERETGLADMSVLIWFVILCMTL